MPFVRLAPSSASELRDLLVVRAPSDVPALYWARLARVYFANLASDASCIGFDDSFIYREMAQPVSRRSVPMIPMMREQALAPFRAWEEKLDKIIY